MGFTHYWRHGDISKTAWDNIRKDVKKLLKSLPEHSFSSGGCYADEPLRLQYEWDDDKNPQVNGEVIRFNGCGDLGHETFMLERIPSGGFNFCKTARKPYDLAVQAVLLIAKHHDPDFSFSSDGGNDEWRVARDFVKELFGYETQDLEEE